MANEVKRKGDDGELKDILIGCGVFTLAVLIVDFTYGNMAGLVSTWLVWPFATFHAALFILWIIVIAKRDEPNFEWARKFVIGFAIATLILVLVHRVGFLDEKDFHQEVDKNKQEQSPSNDN